MKEGYFIYENDYFNIYNTLPRSRLYNLKPEGIGTYRVESLLSYLIRLAEKHHVSVWKLLDVEISEQFSKAYLKGYAKKRQTNHAFSINGCSEITEEYVNALESLTTRDDLINLTLLNGKGLINTKRNILKIHRTWCSECFQNWKTNKLEIYEPLIWNIKYINFCPDHQVKLEEKCPSCGQKNGLISSSHRVGYCGKCGEWLGKESSKENFQVDCTDWDYWCILNFKDILEFFQCSNFVPLGKYSSEILKMLINQYTNGNISEFRRLFKIEHDNVSGRHCISFEKLLTLSFFFKMSIVDLINFKSIDKNNINIQAIEKTTNMQHTYNVVNEKDLRKELLDILNSDQKPPLSMAQVIKISKYSSYTLYKYANDLCKEIALKRKKYIIEKKIEKRNKIKNDVREIVKELLNKGISPTENNVKKWLHDNIYNKELKEIIDEILMETSF